MTLYDSIEIHGQAVWGIFAFAIVTVAMLVLITAPYGRHVRTGWGPEISSRLGWILMESPAVVLFFSIYMGGDHRAELVPMILLSMWMLHYVHRTFIFPFRLRIGGKTMPVLIAAIAIGFNSLNAYVNARWISHFGGVWDRVVDRSEVPRRGIGVHARLDHQHSRRHGAHQPA